MESILVSIISDQTIPNLLIIKELADQYQSQVFITTKKMEEAGKSLWIEKAAGIESRSIKRIVVDENDWIDINEKLVNYNWPCRFQLSGEPYRWNKSNDAGGVYDIFFCSGE